MEEDMILNTLMNPPTCVSTVGDTNPSWSMDVITLDDRWVHYENESGVEGKVEKNFAKIKINTKSLYYDQGKLLDLQRETYMKLPALMSNMKFVKREANLMFFIHVAEEENVFVYSVWTWNIETPHNVTRYSALCDAIHYNLDHCEHIAVTADSITLMYKVYDPDFVSLCHTTLYDYVGHTSTHNQTEAAVISNFISHPTWGGMFIADDRLHISEGECYRIQEYAHMKALYVDIYNDDLVGVYQDDSTLNFYFMNKQENNTLLAPGQCIKCIKNFNIPFETIKRVYSQDAKEVWLIPQKRPVSP